MKIQNDNSASEFSDHLLDLGNGKIFIDPTTGTITFPPNICKLTKFNGELINCVWLCYHAMLAAKTNDSVTQTEDVVNYPLEFLNSLDVLGFPTCLLNLKIGGPTVLLRNVDPPKTLQRNSNCCEKIV